MAAHRMVLLAVVALVAAGCLDSFAPGLANSASAPGSKARDYVSDKTYKKMVVEIHHPSGAGPNAEALAAFQQTLNEVLDKDSIQIQTHQDVPAGNGKKYGWKEIASLESKVRKGFTGGDTAVLHILYLDGGSEDDKSDSAVLGAAYAGSSLVIFKGNIRKATSGDGGLLTLPGSKAEERFVERAVLIHELGHALGLVNLGTPMQRNHEDGEHKGHSSNRQSVMYWAVESSAGLASLLSGGSDIPWRFDSNDKADLAALKGT
ncbi:MAG TPA: hypothetical protein VM889_02805 [Candidatus Thermoplasmatota archaeon]|nr:hypothetical protein [Candidatus Thermoplasmatota archaeon]